MRRASLLAALPLAAWATLLPVPEAAAQSSCPYSVGGFTTRTAPSRDGTRYVVSVQVLSSATTGQPFRVNLTPPSRFTLSPVMEQAPLAANQSRSVMLGYASYQVPDSTLRSRTRITCLG